MSESRGGESRESSFRRRIRSYGTGESRSGESRGGYDRSRSRGSGESRSSGESR